MVNIGDEFPALCLHLPGLGDIGEDDHSRDLIFGIEERSHRRCDPGGYNGAGLGGKVQIQHGGYLIGDGIAHRLAEPLIITGLRQGSVHQFLTPGEVLIGRGIALADHKAAVHQEQAAVHVVQNIICLAALLLHPLPGGRELICQFFNPCCHPGCIPLAGHGHKGVFPIRRKLFQTVRQHCHIPGILLFPGRTAAQKQPHAAGSQQHAAQQNDQHIPIHTIIASFLSR